jgi:hypothetical protein
MWWDMKVAQCLNEIVAIVDPESDRLDSTQVEMLRTTLKRYV